MRLLSIALIATLGFGLTACDPNNRQDRTVGGALIGGGAGALIGAAASRHAGTGALVGGAIGAASGALVGNLTTPDRPAPRRRHCARWSEDDYGNRVCTAHYQ